jgi:hypothetical protein
MRTEKLRVLYRMGDGTSMPVSFSIHKEGQNIVGASMDI